MEFLARVLTTDDGDYLVGPVGVWRRIYPAHRAAPTAEISVRYPVRSLQMRSVPLFDGREITAPSDGPTS